MLLGVGAFNQKGLVLALDIGTNTEVSLIHEGRIASVSCAPGPVFEGYQIKHGMRAARGAIERARINGNSIEYQTIEEAPAVGICGSGVHIRPFVRDHVSFFLNSAKGAMVFLKKVSGCPLTKRSFISPITS
jgi:hypothetical protein